MSWYTTGTINVTKNSKIVKGINTQWTNPLLGVSPGRMLIVQTSTVFEIYEIESIQSDTQLTLSENYDGTTEAGKTYKIPTTPTVSIEQLALEISATLGYYQKQLESWQTILTGDGEVTLTAPNGQTVTIKSQYAISKELISIVEVAKESASQASTSTSNASKSATSAKTSETNSKNSATQAVTSATSAALSETNAAASAKSAKNSETNSKTSETSAAKSALEAKNAASSIDMSNYVKKSDMVGEFKLFPFRASELPKGWYFRGGDNFLLNSPQGQVLNSLSANYKADHGITIKTINGQQYINVPTAFASDGRGYFERAVNGASRQVGSAQDDAIRNVVGGFGVDGIMGSNAGVVWGPYGPFYENGTNASVAKYAVSSTGTTAKIGFDLSRSGIPTGPENTVLNKGMIPAIYLGV